MTDSTDQLSPVRFGLLGCGTIAATQAEAIAAMAAAGARLVACCDIVPAKAAAFAERFGVAAVGWETMLADPTIDAITVCTPSGMHADQGAAALRAGKHVVVEKPMDVTLAACDRLLAAQKLSGKQLAVISQHRFDPASELVKSTLDRGDLGDVVFAEARIPWFRTQEYYDSGDWRGTRALDGGGCLINQGVHTVDLLVWMAGQARTVYAQSRTATHRRIEVEDIVAATLTFESGAVGTLMASTSTYPGFAAQLALHCTNGTAIIEGDCLHTLAIEGKPLMGGQAAASHALEVATGGTRAAAGHVHLEAAAAAAAQAFAWGDAHRAQLAEFVACCRSGARPRVDGGEGRKALQLVLAVYESARTGHVVEIR